MMENLLKRSIESCPNCGMQNKPIAYEDGLPGMGIFSHIFNCTCGCEYYTGMKHFKFLRKRKVEKKFLWFKWNKWVGY